MTREIKKLMAKRQRLYNNGQVTERKRTSNQINNKIRNRKRVFNSKFTNGNTKWWKIVNDARAPAKSDQINAEMAIKLNDNFSNVWAGTKQPDITKNIDRNAAPPSYPIFNPTNIENNLKQLKSSPGPDGLSATVLKSARLEISHIIAVPFNVFIALSFVKSMEKCEHHTNTQSRPSKRTKRLQANLTNFKLM